MNVTRKENTPCDECYQRKQSSRGRRTINEPPGEDKHSIYKSLEQSLTQDTGRKRARVQNYEGQPRHRLSQRTVSDRHGIRECVGKAMTANGCKPRIGFSVTSKWHSHKEPKREPKHCENKVTERLSPCA